MKLLFFKQRWHLAGLPVLVCGLAVFLPVAPMAQTPIPAPAAAGASPALVGIGRLILSPAERRRLEVVRDGASKPDAGPQAVPADRLADSASDLPDTLVVSGYVLRSGNRSTVWVNNQPLYGQAAATPLSALAGRAGVLQAAKNMQPKARPGQVIDVPSGQIVDLLPPGAIRIIPPKAGSGSNTQKE